MDLPTIARHARRVTDDFPTQIRLARERKGLTQEQLGEIVGVARESIANWEAGRTNPRNKKAALMVALGLTPGPQTPSEREFDDLEPAEIEEVEAAARLAALERAREIRVNRARREPLERDQVAGPQDPA